MNAIKRKAKDLPRPKWEKWLPGAFFCLLGYFMADLVSLFAREHMLPSKPPPAKASYVAPIPHNDFGSYSNIIARNIFSSSGIVPEPIKPKDGGKGKEEIPIPSQLPLGLVGTMVHSNPDKSIAAIELKGKNQIISMTTKKEIEGMAMIEKIERMRVFLRNLSSNKLEFIEIKSDSKISFGSNDTSTGKDVRTVGENKYEINRTDLTKYFSDLPSLLMQAQSTIARRPNGDPYGFKIVAIQPGSVFEELGIKPNDVIMGVNGTPITSAQQAMEMYSANRNSNQIKLQVERDGKVMIKDYSIR